MLKNIAANIAGRFWSVLSNYLFIPVYISVLGIENYAVISFSFILIGVMSVMDAGLTATLSREFAKHDEDLSSNRKLRTLNTLETCYWSIALIAIVIVFMFAGPIAKEWISLKSLSVSEVTIALQIFGAGMALQLLSNFYIGGLIGLEHQLRANVYQIIWGIFRNGLVLVVIFLKPSLVLFFSWQAIVTLVYVFFLRNALINTLKKDTGIKIYSFLFDKSLLVASRKFVGGMLLISVVAAINTQLDKIAISKLLPITELGYYNLGISLTQVLLVLIAPISIALLPRFTLLYSTKKNEEADKLFSIVQLVVAILIFSLAGNIIFYSNELLFVWTGDAKLALLSSKYVIYLAIGTGMLALQVIPFNIAIANGYTKINNVLGIGSLFVSIPGYWLSVLYFGSTGAAMTWCIIQTLTTPLYLYYIQKKFLKTQGYFQMLTTQILKPAVAALATAFLLSLILPQFSNRILQLILIGFSTFVTLISAALISISARDIKLYWQMAKKRLLNIGVK